MTGTSIDTCTGIDLLTRKNCSFALYRCPLAGEPVLLIQTAGSPAYMGNLSNMEEHSGFLFSPFSPCAKHPVILMQPDIKAYGWEAISHVWEQPEVSHALQQVISYKEFSDKNQGYSFTQYAKAFSAFIKPLAEKEFGKLVLSRKIMRNRKNDFSPVYAFIHACKKYPTAFVYLFHSPVSGTWLGSTPEILLTKEGAKWHTMALAGTQKINPKDAPDRLPVWDNKNQIEQQYVSDFIRNQLTISGIHWEEKGPYTVQAGNVLHLLTDFYFPLPQNQLFKVIRQLYPSPAICGMPQEKAYRFILENEGYERSYYSGLVGCLDMNGQTSLYVNLRCMHIGLEKLSLYAGGGLLPTSKITTEWKETDDKLQTMLAMIK